jgi:hypothetical protein
MPLLVGHSPAARSHLVLLVATLLLALATSAFPCRAAEKFTVADDIGLTNFGGMYPGEPDAVTRSPDGQYLAVYSERGLVDQNRPESTIRIYRIGDVDEFILSRGSVAPSPIWTITKSTYRDGPIITDTRWLADSTGVAFLAKTELGTDQLFLADVKAKEIAALSLVDQLVTAYEILDRFHFVYTVLI